MTTILPEEDSCAVTLIKEAMVALDNSKSFLSEWGSPNTPEREARKRIDYAKSILEEALTSLKG
jgi:hypothetical protein